MVICEKCGSENKDEAIFCSTCGSNLTKGISFLKEIYQKISSHERKKASPPAIACYITILIVILVIFAVNYREFYEQYIGGFLSIFTVCMLGLGSFRLIQTYYKTKFTELLVFAAVLMVFLGSTLLNFSFFLWWSINPSNPEGNLLRNLFFVLNPEFVFNYLNTHPIISYLNITGRLYWMTLEVPDYWLFFAYLNIILRFVTILAITFYFIRAIWFQSPHRVITYIKLGVILMTIIYFGSLFFFLFYLKNEFGGLILDLLLSLLLMFFSFGILGFKAYLSIKPINPTDRIIVATKLWKIIISLFIILALFWYFGPLFFAFVFFVIFQFMFEPNINLFPNYLIMFSIFLMLTILNLIGYVAFRYPEGLLIFETHLYRAKLAYSKLIEKRELHQDSLTPFPHSAIEEYLSRIPKEFFQKDMREK